MEGEETSLLRVMLLHNERTMEESKRDTSTNYKPYVCKYCNKRFCKYMLLQVHMQVHKSEKVSLCTVKEEPIVDDDLVDTAIASSTIEDGNEISLQDDANKIHVVIPNDAIKVESNVGIDVAVNGSHADEQCYKSIIDSVVLKRQLRTHANVKPLQSYTRARPKEFPIKIKPTKTRARDKTYTCEVCEKVFNRGENLRRHMRIHTGEKPYVCQICKKSFSDSSTCKSHVGTHTGIRPYTCQYCDKSFSRGDNLKTHLRSHTGVKPYKCDDCDKCFSRHEDLKRHSEVHAEVKPFRCEYCRKSFSQSTFLEAHIRNGECKKIYKCEDCLKCFNRSSNLKRHMRVHTGEKPYTCHLCDKCFADGSNLKGHMKTHSSGKRFVEEYPVETYHFTDQTKNSYLEDEGPVDVVDVQ